MRSRRGSAASGPTVWQRRPDGQRFVAGAIGPLDGVSLELARCRRCGIPGGDLRPGEDRLPEQVRALMAGGVDLLLVETIFDSLNAKAALVAIREVFDEDGRGVAGDDFSGRGTRRRDDDLRADD